MRSIYALALVMGLSHAAMADPLEDLVKAQQATYDAWGNVSLTEQKVLFVSEPSAGYGMYKERENAVFKPGEPLITYVEPIGYGWKELPGDMYEMNFVVDFSLATKDGEVITGQKAFSKSVLQSHVANTEFKLELTLNLNNAPAGNYVVTYTIHDMSENQSSTFDQSFEIAAAP